jgi:hypothetical protein
MLTHVPAVAALFIPQIIPLSPKKSLNSSEEVIRIAVAPQITEYIYFGENGAGISIWRQVHFAPKSSYL